MNLNELLKYKEDLIKGYKKAKKQSAKVKFSEEVDQINRAMIRNGAEYSISTWLHIIKEKLEKNLGQEWIVKNFQIEQKKVTKSGELLTIKYQNYICLVKKDALVLKKKYSNEFLEYLLATKFNKTFSNRIIDHSGIKNSETYNFIEPPKKLLGKRNYGEAMPVIKDQVNALIKRQELIVLYTYVSVNKFNCPEKDYKTFKTKISILPSILEIKPREVLTPDMIVQHKVFDICARKLRKNEVDSNRFKRLDIENILLNEDLTKEH